MKSPLICAARISPRETSSDTVMPPPGKRREFLKPKSGARVQVQSRLRYSSARREISSSAQAGRGVISAPPGMRESSSAVLNSASVVPSGRKSQSCPTRERTDLAAFPLNLPLSGRSRAAMASLSVRKSSVPWWRTRPL